ncbi:MAG: acetate kinase [Omnitrophica bacterium]|nr:acetate kinase [Candidatus Omnitrophota bacterium]
MKILVINCGSSSIKYKLFDLDNNQNNIIAKGLIERIGEPKALARDHSQGIKILISDILNKGGVKDLNEISVIGHRVVHGGETFLKPQLINAEVIRKIRKYAQLAPLHNPVNLAGIIGCRRFFSRIPQVAIFDTAFHQSIPEEAYMYALPKRYYKKYKLRKYGFHGTSHQFIARQASKLLGKPLNKLKLITCHLGNGCSITAIDKGKSIDTSMGFTPLEGLMMGTRCGDIDVAAVFYIMKNEGLSLLEMDNVLNRKSGLLGISGISNDFRVIRKFRKSGNLSANLAWKMFVYRIKKYIGAYYFILGGVDAVCFTGGIGENSPGIVNAIKQVLVKISGKETKVLVIPTDEELMIAKLTYKVVKKKLK